MAVAMEVAWRAGGGGGGGVGELGSSSTPPGVSIQDVEASLKMKNNVGPANKMNKRAWGADAHKLVQLMMNPLQQQQQRQQQLHAGGNLEAKKGADDEEEEEEEEEEVTLDLLGPSSPPTKLQKLEEEKHEVRELEPRGAELEPRSREFLELEPADQPLPSGWEKCLDLKVSAIQHSYPTSNNLFMWFVFVLFYSVLYFALFCFVVFFDRKWMYYEASGQVTMIEVEVYNVAMLLPYHSGVGYQFGCFSTNQPTIIKRRVRELILRLALGD